MKQVLSIIAALLTTSPAIGQAQEYARSVAQATEDLRTVEHFLRHTGRVCLINPHSVSNGAGSVCWVADNTLSILVRLRVQYRLKHYRCSTELRFDVRDQGIDYSHTVVTCDGAPVPEVAEQVNGPNTVGWLLSVLAAYARSLNNMEGFGFA